jgi:hypothetical protein
VAKTQLLIDSLDLTVSDVSVLSNNVIFDFDQIFCQKSCKKSVPQFKVRNIRADQKKKIRR